MERTPTSLQELAQLVIDVQGASARRVAALAEKKGLRLTHTTLNAMRAGTYKWAPREDTVRALAQLAGIPVEVAFHAAGLPVPGPPLADELPPGSDNLSPRSRAAVIQMLRVLIDLESNTDDNPRKQDNTAERGDPEEQPAPGRERERRDDARERADRASAARRGGAGGRDARAGQKTSAAGGQPDRSLDPADYDLAAHPPMELARDRMERQLGDDGEENQDHEGEDAS